MKSRLTAFAGTVRRFVRSVLAPKTQSLFHPESPGVRVEITRTRFGRWFKPADFATLGEMIKHYRANDKAHSCRVSAAKEA